MWMFPLFSLYQCCLSLLLCSLVQFSALSVLLVRFLSLFFSSLFYNFVCDTACVSSHIPPSFRLWSPPLPPDLHLQVGTHHSGCFQQAFLDLPIAHQYFYHYYDCCLLWMLCDSSCLSCWIATNYIVGWYICFL